MYQILTVNVRWLPVISSAGKKLLGVYLMYLGVVGKFEFFDFVNGTYAQNINVSK